MKYQQWERSVFRPEARAELEQAGIPPLAALTLCARGLDTAEKAQAFLASGRASYITGSTLDVNGGIFMR